jgi:hypothetical protein
VSWNPCRHGYDDRTFLRKSRSEAGVEKMIDTKDGNGNGNDKTGNRNGVPALRVRSRWKMVSRVGLNRTILRRSYSCAKFTGLAADETVPPP